MLTFNKILLLGHLTGDPEQKTTATNKTVTTFGVATNHRFSTPDGKTDQRTCFVDVTTWGTLAGTCAATLKKGHPVFIEGRLELSRWEKEDKTYSKLFVQATTVVFLSPLEKKSPSPSKVSSVARSRESGATATP